jgi:hypoxanthine phosphoribosyltransferase
VNTLITAEEIRNRTAELGQELSLIYRDCEVVILPVLKGSFVFAADLIRAMTCGVTVDFIGAASYGASTVSSGEVRLTHDTTVPLAGKHVLLVEDIVDTGLTLAYIQKLIMSRSPADLRTVALLDKPSRRRVKVGLYRALFEIPDRFVVGYGLDGPGGLYRNLPYVAVLQ